MEKIMIIEGMSCKHCAKRVEEAINSIPGAVCRVELKNNRARVKLKEEISDSKLTEAVEAAGYIVRGIE